MEAKPRLTRRIKRSHIVGQQSDGIPLYVSTTALRACFVRKIHPQNRHASKVGRHSTFMGGVSKYCHWTIGIHRCERRRKNRSV